MFYACSSEATVGERWWDEDEAVKEMDEEVEKQEVGKRKWS